MMARGVKPRAAPLRLVEGRAPGRDSGGRVVKTPPPFRRIPPERPEHLSDIAAELWDRIVAELPRLGLLKELDGPSLEMLCETYAMWRDAKSKRERLGALGKNSQGVMIAPWTRLEREAANDFRSWCSEYGLTPSAEMRVSGQTTGPGEPNDHNPFAG
jgi:P27 family predicted phage terminase small subunit